MAQRAESQQQRETRNDERRAISLEEQLRAEKATQIVEKMREQREIAQYMSELRANYIALDNELSALKDERNRYNTELPRLDFRAENIDEHAKNLEVLQHRAAKTHAERQSLHAWNMAQKKETDKKIALMEQEIQRAQDFFFNRFNIDPAQAPEEIKRIQAEIHAKKEALNATNARISTITEELDTIEQQYHTQKLLADTRPDKDKIYQLLERMNKPPETLYTRLLHERLDRRLNIIPDEAFQKVLEKLPSEYAQILIEERKRSKIIEREPEKTHAQTRTIERSH
jgi:hypothetical protein